MSKLNYKDKINLYIDRKMGMSVYLVAKKYNITVNGVNYLVRLINRHGYDILRKNKNREYSRHIKEQAINRVLINNESVWSVAIDIGLPSNGMLCNWIKNYKEMGYNIVERKRGRSPTIMSKKDLKPKTKETIEEENERLKKENLYLKAELEYSKKLRAVVQARKNQQQKKK